MIDRILLVFAALLLFAGTGIQAQSIEPGAGKGKTGTVPNTQAGAARSGNSGSSYAPVHDYDPKRDPGLDLKLAIAEAERTGKRVLVEVGGQWCIWCHHMDDFFVANPDLLKQREANFIMVKVNFSEENKNEAFLSGYPAVAGYPHIFVLDSDGSLLHSEDTSELEDGQKSYRLDNFTAFLSKWSPEKN
jgi:hypothetical protein